MILGALDGNATKKRVVFGNFIFNVFLTSFAILFLKPILNLITNTLNIKDHLIGLVTFSSMINLFTILIFLPFLDKFVKFLEHFFKETNDSTAAYINHANIAEPLTALDLFRRETKYFIHNAMLFNLELFEIDSNKLNENPSFKNINEKRNFLLKSTEEKYEFIKQLHGELQAFYLKLRSKLQSEQFSEINQLISAGRSAMHSVKSVKDIGSNISNLSQSSKNIKYNFFLHHKKETEILYLKLYDLIVQEKTTNYENLKELFNVIENNYSSSLNNFYTEAQKENIENIDITTIINFNRELFTSNKGMLMAVKDIILKEKEAEEFNEIPKYKT